MEAVKTPPRSAFFGHRYDQHAARDCNGEHCACYHSCLTPENHDLPDAVAFACGGSIALDAEKHSLLVEYRLDQQAGDLDEQCRLIQSSRGSSKSEGSHSELSMSMPERRNTSQAEYATTYNTNNATFFC